MKSIIEDMARYAELSNMNVYAITEILGGNVRTAILKEDSYCRDVYSVSKAFVMAAIGLLFDDRLIKPQDTVADIFGTLPAGSDARWAAVTVSDALRHRTGLTNGNIDIDREDILQFAGEDWLECTFKLPLDGIRGQTYKYTDTSFYLLSCMVTKLTGKSLVDYLREKLFVPLGFKEYAWSTCPKGICAGGSGLFVACEDMAKLGKLWLDYGVFNGKRIISEQWVKTALENEYAFSPRNEKYNGFYKTGAHSQILYFSYEQNLVIAVQSFAPSEQLTALVDAFL